MEASRTYDFKNLHYKGEGGVLIPLLQQVQTEDGYISRERIAEIHRKTGVPLSQIFGVATFYAQFRLHPVGRNVIKVCHGTACHVAGPTRSPGRSRTSCRSGTGRPPRTALFTLETVSCLGCCSLAPVIMVNKDTHGNLKPTDLKKVLKPYRDGEAGGAHVRILVGLGTCGVAAGAGATYAALAGEGGAARRQLHGREDRLHRHVLPRAARRGARRRRGALAVRADDPGQGRPAARGARREGRAHRGVAGLVQRRQGARRTPSSTASTASCCATAG